MKRFLVLVSVFALLILIGSYSGVYAQSEAKPIIFQLRIVDDSPDSKAPEVKVRNTEKTIRLIEAPVIDQADIATAEMKPGQDYVDILLTLTPAGAGKLSEATAANAGKKLGIVVDDRYKAAMMISGKVTGNRIVIRGFSQEDAKDIVDRLSALAKPGVTPAAAPAPVVPTPAAAPVKAISFQLRLVDESPESKAPQVKIKGSEQTLRLILPAVLEETDIASAELKIENNLTNILLFLTPAGAKKLEQQTAANLGKKRAIVVDGEPGTAGMTITAQISAQKLVVTGFTPEQAGDIVDRLNARAKPAEAPAATPPTAPAPVSPAPAATPAALPAPVEGIIFQMRIVDESPDSQAQQFPVRSTKRTIRLLESPLIELTDIASAEMKPGTDYAALIINFNPQGAAKFSQMTAANLGKKLGIVVEGRYKAAMVITAQVNTPRITIQGFSQEEAQELVQKINAQVGKTK